MAGQDGTRFFPEARVTGEVPGEFLRDLALEERSGTSPNLPSTRAPRMIPQSWQGSDHPGVRVLLKIRAQRRLGCRLQDSGGVAAGQVAERGQGGGVELPQRGPAALAGLAALVGSDFAPEDACRSRYRDTDIGFTANT